MPCLCDQKVERSQQKIQCSKCNCLFHIGCVNILPADAEFLRSSDKPFYCKVCAADRRGSIRSPPPILVLDDSIVTAPIKVSDASNPEVFNSSSACQIDNLVESLNSSQQNERNGKTTHLNDVNEQITLQKLYAEIVTLREQNSNILAKVNELFDDKQRLLIKTESLQAELHSLQSKFCIEQIVLSIDNLSAQIKTLRTDVCRSRTPCIYPTTNSLASNCEYLFSTEGSGSSTHVSAVSAVSNTYAATAAAASTAASTSSKDLICASQKTPHANVRAVNNNSSPNTLTSIPPISTVSVSTTEKTDSLTYAAAASVNSFSFGAPAHAVTTATSSRSLAQPQWEKVQNKKGKNKKAESSVVIGQNSSKDLDVFASRRWLHLSSFKPTVNEENILSFVSKNAGIDKDNLSCFKLVKKGADTSLLKKVNFKLGVNASLYDKVVNPALWPANVELRPFKFFQKEETPQNQK